MHTSLVLCMGTGAGLDSVTNTHWLSDLGFSVVILNELPGITFGLCGHCS
jgi:hypothetical protein